MTLNLNFTLSLTPTLILQVHDRKAHMACYPGNGTEVCRQTVDKTTH